MENLFIFIFIFSYVNRVHKRVNGMGVKKPTLTITDHAGKPEFMNGIDGVSRRAGAYGVPDKGGVDEGAGDVRG